MFWTNDFAWGPKNQRFGNNSGKAQPIQTRFGTHAHVKGDNVQEILGAG